MSKLVDEVAKAIEPMFPPQLVRLGVPIEVARAALAAIDASGTHRVLPVEATEEMVQEGVRQWFDQGIRRTGSVWTAMLAAAPKVE